jgi:hypothetical protein
LYIVNEQRYSGKGFGEIEWMMEDSRFSFGVDDTP